MKEEMDKLVARRAGSGEAVAKAGVLFILRRRSGSDVTELLFLGYVGVQYTQPRIYL